jgi:hypothetical protein
MTIPGGYGITAHGRSEYGNAKSDIEPRFYASVPVDHQTNVSVNKVIKFETYGFSSWIDIADVLVEISEDDGISYLPAFQYEAFQFPYANNNSRYFRPDGQRLTFMFHKMGRWNSGTRIVIRFTGKDEFGQYASKTIPVTWE